MWKRINSRQWIVAIWAWGILSWPGCVLSQGQPSLQLQIGHSSISNVAFSPAPTGALVASTDVQGVIKIWETKEGRLVCTIDSGDNISAVTTAGLANVAWSADGSQLLAPDNRGGFFLWKLQQCGERTRLDAGGQQIPEPPATESASGRSSNILSLATISGNRVLVQTANGLGELSPFAGRSTPSSNGLGTQPSKSESSGPGRPQTRADLMLATSNDGRFVLLGGLGGPRTVLDRQKGTTFQVPDFENIDGPAAMIGGKPRPMVQLSQRTYAFSPSGQWLVVKSAIDTTLRLYDLRNQSLAASTPMLPVVEPSKTPPTSDQRIADSWKFNIQTQEIRAGVAGLAFSSDEKRLYVYRDRGMDHGLGGAFFEIRDAKTLSLVSQTKISEPKPLRMSQYKMLSIPHQVSDRVLIPVSHSYGIELLNVNPRSGGVEVEAWSLDSANRIGALTYGPGAVFAQGVTSSSDELHRQRIQLAKLGSRTPEEEKKLVSLQNEWFKTYVDAWTSDRAEVVREPIINTTAIGPNLGAFSNGGRFYAAQTKQAHPERLDLLSYWDMASRKQLWKAVAAPVGWISVALAVNDKGTMVALWVRKQAGNAAELKLFDGATGQMISSLPIDFKYTNTNARLTFATDDSELYFSDSYHMTGAFDLGSLKAPHLIWARESSGRHPLGFLPRSGSLVMPKLAPFIDVEKSAYHAKLFGGWAKVFRIPVADEDGLAVANFDESLLAVTQKDHVIRLFSMKGEPRKIGQISGITSRITSMAFAPDGRRLLASDDDGGIWIFDVERQQLLARMYTFGDGNWVVVDPSGRFDTNNIEAMGRLHWVLPDEPYKAYPLELFMRDFFTPQLWPRIMAGLAMPAVPDVASVNRAQPAIVISSIKASTTQPGRVDVSIQIRQTRDFRGRNSGAKNLMLFRSGQLVGRSPLDESKIAKNLGQNKEVQVEFHGIRLPSAREPIDFSAYAFNTDGVKSTTTKVIFRPTAVAQSTRRRAFVVSVGVNTHDTPEWNLTFAANDAHRTQDILVAQLRATGRYDEIIPLPLISDEHSSNARKEIVRAVLAKLAGRPAESAALANVPGSSSLDAATPDDLVIITFSGHGFADSNEFYLVPQDIGGSRRVDDGTRQHSISTLELANWLEDIDAGDLSLVIDACHSAAAVETGGFKAGPMGAKGLGQLAYDKGIRILAATQADDVALESGRLRQGLLSFALMSEGLEQAKADYHPVDGKIDVAEWLAFAARRVPEIYLAIQSGQQILATGSDPWKIENRSASRIRANAVKVQRPTLFNFRRVEQSPILSEVRGSH